jgi:predicted 3-demethylubiquinone-9 3-methyltransferase (glyoxalase superfamily)
MTKNKITPALWFHTEDGKMKHVIDYYAKIFENNFVADIPVSLGATPSGYTEMCNVKFFDNNYLLLTTAIEHHSFNDTFAIMIHCKDQAEIDKFWNYFTKEGTESMCGWCMDKFGLRWQIIPENLGELMSKPNAGQVMYKQRKIVIAEYMS